MLVKEKPKSAFLCSSFDLGRCARSGVQGVRLASASLHGPLILYRSSRRLGWELERRAALCQQHQLQLVQQRLRLRLQLHPQVLSSVFCIERLLLPLQSITLHQGPPRTSSQTFV